MCLWVWRPESALVNLTNRDPANGDALLGMTGERVDFLLSTCKRLNSPIGVQNIRHYGLSAGLDPSSRARCMLSMSLSTSRSAQLPATLASATLTLTGLPSAMPSSAQRRYAGWMRYMVEQGQTTGSRQNTSLSGFSLARRLTRLISVATAHCEPVGAAAMVLAMNSVEPT